MPHTKTETHPVQGPPEREELELSQNPDKAMQEMMNVIDTLRLVYLRETDALTKSDTETFLSLQGEKLEAARSYQNGIRQMLERKDEMKEASPDLKNRLGDMQKDFSALAQKNAEALQRMNRCIERLGNTIRNAAKETAKKQHGFSYDQTGSMKHTEKKSISTGVSETA